MKSDELAAWASGRLGVAVKPNQIRTFLSRNRPKVAPKPKTDGAKLPRAPLPVDSDCTLEALKRRLFALVDDPTTEADLKVEFADRIVEIDDILYDRANP